MADMTRGITQYVARLPIDPYVCITDKKNREYAQRVVDSTNLGMNAVFSFGNLGGDTFNYQGKQMIGSPIEYYYTDLVFLRNDYETALVGLYRNLAEMPNKRGEINEAIGLVKEVAKRRGVNVSENNAKARYRSEITNEILTTGSRHFSNVDKNREYCQSIIDYYLNPTTSNFNKVVRTAKNVINRDNNLFCSYMDTLSELSLDFRCVVSSRL